MEGKVVETPINDEKRDSREEIRLNVGFQTSLNDRRKCYLNEEKGRKDFSHRFAILSKEKKRDQTLQFDEGSFHLTNDPQAFIYRRLKQILKQEEEKNQFEIEEKEKIKKCLQYGKELEEILLDRRGFLKDKFDKVFIS